MEDYTGWLVFGGVIGVLWLVVYISNIIEEKGLLQKHNEKLKIANQNLLDNVSEWKSYSESLEQSNNDTEKRQKIHAKSLQEKENQLNKEKKLFKKLFEERTNNYPVVGKIWAELINLTEEERARALKYKKRPALKAAEEVQTIKREKRELVKELISWKYKSQNYEAIYPWLTEQLELDIQSEVEADIYYTVYSSEERDDPASEFLSPEDYRKLSISERNQLALDRYWKRGKKTKWMIGKMYERYVGHLYEKEGWDVEYFGIHKRFEDLGRDLIATKGKEIHVIQCKNWARFRTIYENHIFQLFGTTFSVQKENPNMKVVPVFYCSTKLSDTANEFSKRLGIEVHQNHSFEAYPAIKCNISPNKEKIYHLPFDQQYDTIKITPKTGEFYAGSIKDAENKGFRRAFKWRGNKA